MTPKDRYRKLCEDESTIPIFSRDWWLDAVCGDAWDVCLVEKGGEIVASMPYHIKRRWGFTFVTQPMLTQTLGPWLRPSDAKYSNRLALEKERLTGLVDDLPRFDYFSQNWHYGNKNWLPLYWRGFQQTTRYTYGIDHLAELDRVYSEFSSSYRNKIRKASGVVQVVDDLGLSVFFDINRLTFERQGLKIPYSFDFLKKTDNTLYRRGNRKIFFAKDGHGNIHSALYLIWDGQSSYVHMVGEDPAFRSSGAGILLIWEAIRFTVKVLGLEKLDFEGSMMEGVERVRRDCGAKQIPYFSISKTSSRLLRAAQAMRTVLST